MNRQFALVLFSLVFLFGFSFATDLAACQDVTVSNDDYVVTAAWLDNDSTCFSISADNITFDCQGATLNYTGGLSDHNTGILVSGQNVTIRNCIIYGWRNINQHAIHVVGTTDVLANNCTLNNSYDSFCVDSATYVYLNNSFVETSSRHGVYTVTGANATIFNTEFYENINSAIYFAGNATDGLVDNCTIDGGTKGAYGVVAFSPYSTIRNSFVTSVTGICIRFEDTAHIYNNIATYCNYDGGAPERTGGIGTSQEGGHLAMVYNNRVLHTRGWAFADAYAVATNDTFHSNYAYNITDHGRDRNGIGYYFYLSPGLTAYNNTAENVTGTGMYITESDRTSIYNNSISDTEEHGIWVHMFSENSTIYDNLVWDIGETGIYVELGRNTTVRNNEVHDATDGVLVVSSDLTYLESNILYNNLVDFGAWNNGALGPGVSFNYTMVDTTFRNPAGSTTDAYTVLSIQDEVVEDEQYSVAWTATPTPLPGGLSSFRNKFVEINNVTADPVSISEIIWGWTAAEVSGYDESSFAIWEYDNGAAIWTDMGATLDMGANTLTLDNLDPSCLYGILGNTSEGTNGGGGEDEDLEIEVSKPAYVGGEVTITVTSDGNPINAHVKVYYPGSSEWYYLVDTGSDGETSFVPEYEGDHKAIAEKSGFNDANEWFDVLASVECITTLDCTEVYGDCYVCEIHRDPADNQCVLKEGAECGVDADCIGYSKKPGDDAYIDLPKEDYTDDGYPSNSLFVCIDCMCEPAECLTDEDCPSNEYCDDGVCRPIPEAEPEEEPEEPGEEEIIIEEETRDGEPPLPEPGEIAKDVVPLVGGIEEGGEASETWASVSEWGWWLLLLIIIAAAIYIFFINQAKKGGKSKRK